MSINWKVRAGDDGVTKFQSEDKQEAMDFAKEMSKTNWSGNAYVRIWTGHSAYNVARFRNGELVWEDTTSRLT